MTLKTSYRPRIGIPLETWGKAVKILQDHYVAKSVDQERRGPPRHHG